jgi:metal-responsive CopG/Arc/MetJ family transcriptional regulator
MKKTTPIPVRLESDMVQKLDKLAAQQFNSRAGMIRMSVAMLIQSMEAAEVKPQEPTAAPEAA